MAKKRTTSKATPKKPREMGLTFTAAEAGTLVGVSIGADGAFIPMGADGPVRMSSAAVEWSYDRPKGRKVLFRAPVDVSTPSLNPDSLLRNYHAIIAVDTNVRRIHGVDVAVSAVTQGVRTRGPTGLQMTSRPLCAFELHGLKSDPEKVGWWTAIRHLMSAPGGLADRRVALVVDAHLGEIDSINARTVGIIGNELMPPPFTLIFATDAAIDSVMNALIRECHRDADAVLDLVASDRARTSLKDAARDDPYSQWRLWSWRPTPAA